jgi:SAM-dependent methyltransferase
MDHARIYDFRFRDIPDAQKRIAWNRIARHVQGFMPGAKRLLDPCAGRCEFVNHAEAGEVWAVDREASFLEAARPGVKRVAGDIFEVALPPGYFDGIFVSNFLEHLESAEMACVFLGRMREALAPGGRLVIMGPNFKYCGDEYFDCADHRLVLTHQAVEELLYAERFGTVKVHPRYLPYSFRRQRLPVLDFLVRAYLAFPPAWRILGKQFLIVAEKPRDPAAGPGGRAA